MLKPIRRDQTIGVVSVQDDAIDFAASPTVDGDVLAYVDERRSNPGCWREKLVFRDGHDPTVFIVGLAPASVLNRIDDECIHGPKEPRRTEAFWRCFLASVRDIDHGFGTDVPKEDRDGVQYLSLIHISEPTRLQV